MDHVHSTLTVSDTAQLHAGQSIVINGASGAVGTAAIQLAKHLGATVTAVCSTANVELVRTLGADSVIDYKVEDFTRNTGAYDVVFDTVATSSFTRSRRALKRGGFYLTAMPSLTILLQMLWTKQIGPKKAAINFTGLAKPAELVKNLEFIAKLAESGDSFRSSEQHIRSKARPKHTASSTRGTRHEAQSSPSDPSSDRATQDAGAPT